MAPEIGAGLCKQGRLFVPMCEYYLTMNLIAFTVQINYHGKLFAPQLVSVCAVFSLLKVSLVFHFYSGFLMACPSD